MTYFFGHFISMQDILDMIFWGVQTCKFCTRYGLLARMPVGARLISPEASHIFLGFAKVVHTRGIVHTTGPQVLIF